MIEILPNSHHDMLVVRGSGTLSEEDYEEVLLPRLDELIEEYDKVRFLFLMDEDFRGWDSSAAIDYAKYGVRHRNDFSKVGAVCGPKWVHWEFKLKSAFTDAAVKTFDCGEEDEALKWIEV